MALLAVIAVAAVSVVPAGAIAWMSYKSLEQVSCLDALMSGLMPARELVD